LDACHAAGVLAPGVAIGAQYGTLLNHLQDRYRLFASCATDQYSYEDTLGLKAGVFAHYLAEGLAGSADANHDGVIELNELVDYVDAHVRDWCRATLEPGQPVQTPTRLPAGWSDNLPLAFTPWRVARDALTRLGVALTPAEHREAE